MRLLRLRSQNRARTSLAPLDVFSCCHAERDPATAGDVGCFSAVVLFAAFTLSTTTVLAAPVTWPPWRQPLLEKFSGEMGEADTILQKKPDSVPTLSRRGDIYLFLGAYPEAIADFKKMIELDPSQDAQHWRLGIAYYFTGEYAKAEAQFVKYHTFDNHDRENGIWKFLCQVKVDGLEKARAEMLTYPDPNDREPFVALYEMFAGKRTPDDVFTDIQRKGLAQDKQVMFFANYYVGLYDEMQGHPQWAVDYLRKAVDLLPATADTVYMWNVCRLEWEKLVTEQARGK
jgi:lipoprotein NlpI